MLLAAFSCLASALPDAATERSGDLCERAHPFTYAYSFTYDRTLGLGSAADLTMSFSFQGTEVARSPRTVDVEVASDGFEVSETRFSLEGGKKTLTIRPTIENPTLTFKTTLSIDGDEPRHRGYSASYVDSFTLKDFSVVSEQGSSSSTLAESSSSTTLVEFVVEQTAPSPAPWYIVRAAGLIAYLLLAMSVGIGLLRKIDPKRFSHIFRIHCDVSYFALAFTFLHAATTLLDKYQWNLGLSEAFWFDFSSSTSTMLSLGVLAFYLMAIISATSLTPKVMAKFKRKRWHLLHLAAYGAYVFVVAHSFVLGTDLGNANPGDPFATAASAGFLLLAAANVILVLFFLYKRKRR
jgi:DMSO/TMAO reductase YedYZ heme-binding membrane subunit